MPWPTFSASDDPIDTLVMISRYYGCDADFVLAGGGNTSVKIGDRLFVKASGYPLATLTREGLVELDRTKLSQLLQSDLGSERVEREERFKTAIMASRIDSTGGKRPSVESVVHHVVPGVFVVHTHATVVNTLTCMRGGEKLCRELFGDAVLWVPVVDPGYPLAKMIHQLLAGAKSPKDIKAIFMANHGLIVFGDNPETIRSNTEHVLATIGGRLGSDWEQALGAPERIDSARLLVNTIGPMLRGLLADGSCLKVVSYDDGPLVMQLVGTVIGKQLALAGPLTPDQIVYCNSYPLWADVEPTMEPPALLEKLRASLAEHQQRTGDKPKVILVKGLGMFTVGDDAAGAATVREVYIDAIRVMCGAHRLGGASPLPDDQRKFIEAWEVEAYRKSIARLSAGKAGRALGKIAVVTGAAQGFGLEIAQGFVAQGGHVVLTDLNHQTAIDAAAKLCEQHGRGRAIALPINVTDGASVAECLHQVVRSFGGFDVLVSNAGVLKAGSVKTQPVKDFDFVTAVNYKGYFVCVQQAAPILALQHMARLDYLADIIQINSKSGLQGSNKNGAYAGSKFGGIGLTQSFALELIEDGIKVNSICPGNFFDGPLWSDPNTGLFVQYLRTGKVPGAKTIEDVKKFYEAKVPMGRGCTTTDVMKAIFYLMEQQYETGQAVPVTGGQVMLS